MFAGPKLAGWLVILAGLAVAIVVITRENEFAALVYGSGAVAALALIAAGIGIVASLGASEPRRVGPPASLALLAAIWLAVYPLVVDVDRTYLAVTLVAAVVVFVLAIYALAAGRRAAQAAEGRTWPVGR